MIVTTLGTSHGNHTYCRFNSATLIESGDRSILLDTGEPVSGQMTRLDKSFDALKAVFLTHMHADHSGGLPNLIKTLRKYPKDGKHTTVFLPEPEATEPLHAWLTAQHVAVPPSVMDFAGVHAGPLYDDGTFAVTAIPTRHLAALAGGVGSYAYMVEAEGKRVVYTGDLKGDFSDFPDIARSEPCDLCVCEATHYKMEPALDLLATYPIKHLVFNHVHDPWHGDGEQTLMDMAARLPFPHHIAHDGDVFEV